MSGLNLQRILLGAAVTVAAFAVDAPQANAFWRWHGSSGGSSGGSWGSSGGSWGSSGGSSGGWRHHRRWHHSSGGCSGGSSGGSSGGWSSSGGSYGGAVAAGWGYGGGTGSYGSWGSSGGGSYGSGGGSYGSGSYPGGHEVQSVPMEEGAPVDAAPAPPANGDMTYNLDHNSMMLSVTVPADAKVFVNDRLTSSTGSVRRFVSRGLDPNATYTYEVRAEVTRNGKTETDTKTIKVGGGQVADLAFAFDRNEAEHVAQGPLKTSLILRVPNDAKVFLAGKETKSTGEVREFATTKLPNGGEWNDYSIRVELNRDGQTLSKETNVSLAAGEARSVMVDFDATEVAQAINR